MKTSLSHLPQDKQSEILRIVEVIREVVNPEMIILFGSHAKGTYVEDRYKGNDGIVYEYISDYDFLVVTKNNSEKTYVQEGTILDRVDRYGPPVNLEIHEIGYINEGLEWGQYFFTDIANEGILLYNTGETEFTNSLSLIPEEEKKKAQEYFDIWFGSGSRFLKICIDSFKKTDPENAKLNEIVFILHQATESLYYATLLVFTGYKPKTHNLWKLRKKTKPFSKELFAVFNAEGNKREESLFDLLKRGYIEARYKADYSITQDELSVLLERIMKLSQIVNTICTAKIDSWSAD